MNNSQKSKVPVPHHGRRVNNWETLRPYVEMAAPPKQDNIADGGENAKIDPKWGFGYQAELSENNSTFSPEEK